MSSESAMPSEEQDWMLCVLCAALGVAFGSFFCTAFFSLSKPSWGFSSVKDFSAGCRKTFSASYRRKTPQLQLFHSNGISMEGHRRALSDTHDTQLYVSQPPIDVIKREGNKGTPLSETYSDMSQHPLPGMSTPDDNENDRMLGSEMLIHASTPSAGLTLPRCHLTSDPFDPSKRQGYLSWDDYFMAIAFLSAKRSKDPNRQVGACLVSQDRVILGIGYNGFPRGCSDDKLPWAKMSVDGNPLQTKYPYVCHAEVNAILNKNHASACGQRLYVTMFPCNECAKIIIQAGVAEVVYFISKNSSSECSYVASRKLLSLAGVKVWQHQPSQKTLILDFK